MSLNKGNYPGEGIQPGGHGANHVPFVFAGELGFEKDTSKWVKRDTIGQILSFSFVHLNAIIILEQLHVIEESIVYQ